MIFVGFESHTHSLVDHALQVLPVFLPVLDFSTIKNELFPVVANVFAKTSSMAIKIQGLHALNSLCGGSSGPEPDIGDGLDGVQSQPKSTSSSAMLDKFTIQEKIVPLLRAIKTKEPAVMMAALSVFRQVGKVADADFLAFEALPCLWSFSLGPLLNLEQFQDFMQLIKSLSAKIEQEQTRKLSELSANSSTTRRAGGSSFGGVNSTNGVSNTTSESTDTDFESLVTGRGRSTKTDDLFDGGWGSETTIRPANPRINSMPQPQSANAPRFSWQTAPSPSLSNGLGAAQQARAGSGTVTPDNLGSFATLTPSQPSSATSANPWSQPLQPQQPLPLQQSLNSTPVPPPPPPPSHSHRQSASISQTSIDWSSASRRINAPMSSPLNSSPAVGVMQRNQSSGQVGPANSNGFSNFSIAPPPTSPPGMNVQMPNRTGPGTLQQNSQPKKQGLDKYESLI